MHIQTGDRSLTNNPERDPAVAAAAMLLRLGFAIFAIVLPSAILMSRWVIVVLVPIGAILIILSAVLRGDPFRVLRDLARSLWSVPGLTGLSLVLWALLSLGWTGQPGAAADKIFKTVGVVVLGLLAVHALPARMRATNLHLITIGVALGALLILASVVAQTLGFALLRFPSGTPGRTAIMLTCLGWAAAAWLMIKDRRLLAAILIVLVAGVALFGPTTNAIAPMAVGLIVFALAWSAPERAGTGLGTLAAAIILLAPIVALAARLLANVFGLPGDGSLAQFGAWWGHAAAEPLRLMTGWGFNAAHAAREAGQMPVTVPISLLTDTWYDLGLLGAIGFAILVFSAMQAAGRSGLEVAPLALAGLAAAFTYAVIAIGAIQTWWMNGMMVFAVVLLSVERGRYRTVRPRAALRGTPLPAPPGEAADGTSAR
jgi:hypothetical protein